MKRTHALVGTALAFAAAAVEPTRLVISPGEYHGLTMPSYIKDKMQRILDWYGLYLGVLPRP